MNREEMRLLANKCLEMYEKSNFGERKRFLSRWYFSLTDEKRDCLDMVVFYFCAPDTERVRLDRVRREALRDARERDGFLEEVKKKLAFLKKRDGGHYNEAVARAEKLRLLFKIRLSEAISFEAIWDYSFGLGWNTYLLTAIKEGRLPKEKKIQPDDNTTRVWEAGWNAA